MKRDDKNYWRSMISVIVVVFGLMVRVGSATAACVIQDSSEKPVQNNNDPLAQFLSAADACPQNVFEFRSRLTSAGAKLRPALVANGGFHNPKNNPNQVQMMLFEIVSGHLNQPNVEINDGEFFFGHFITTDGTNLKAGRDVFIELIARDPVKEVFNFYELTRDRKGRPGWFYRGDSLDIQQDVRLLHRQPDPHNPSFGNRLRCSGCHIAGGPIMKELAAPHNDWGRTERLPFDPRRADAPLSEILQGLVDASELAKSVKVGLAQLEESQKFQQAKRTLTLQEQLRPLFCPVELNLESDTTPFDHKAPKIEIPSAFFLDPMLAKGAVAVERAHYEAALTAAQTKFPGTSQADADHGWLTPVKAFSDTLVIGSLVKQGVIDQEFVSDVLAVDLTNPLSLLPTARCKLLRVLPENAAGDWQEVFKASLRASNDPAAQELLKNLTDPSRNAQFHQTRAARFLDEVQKRLQAKEAVIEMYQLLAQRREEVKASEISQNPKGRILEPGFRVVFPDTPGANPGRLRLTEDGRVIAQ
jgi:hypothetical protein